MHTIKKLFTLFCTLFIFVLPFQAQELDIKFDVSNLGASGLDDADFFGLAVSISGDRAIVGGSDNNAGIRAGEVFIFEMQAGTWTAVAHFDISNMAAFGLDDGDRFGEAVAVDGHWAFVGAYQDEPNDAGSVYIFQRQAGTWSFFQKLDASSLGAEGLDDGDFFGISVSVSGLRAVVGSFFDEPNFAGSAYIFELSGGAWNLMEKLDATNLGAQGLDMQDVFGGSVSISGNQLMVSSVNDEPIIGFSGIGSIYFFEEQAGTWSFIEKFDSTNMGFTNLPPNREFNFGESVSISGNYAITGTQNGFRGSAYIFERNAGVWNFVASFDTSNLASEGLEPSDGFGRSVAVDGYRAVVGSYQDDPNFAGSAYIFERRNGVWTFVNKLESANLANEGLDERDVFGTAVALSGDRILIGSNGDEPNFTGSAYFFSFPTPPVPTMSQWALLLFSLVMLTLSVVGIYNIHRIKV